jgi:glycosyltransferase involved in cell wall biosynthesis
MDNPFVIAGFVLALSLWWIVMPLRAVLHGRKLRSLSALDLDTPAEWPRVSVLVPARNEEDTLFVAVQSLLQVDYPDLEIILINDRSTDRTGEVAERLAQLDPRIRRIDIEQLPEGWLGKVHALQQGVRASRGEWLLFTDADIHFAPQALKKAVAYCLQYRKGFLALFPELVNIRGLVGMAQAAFEVMLLSLLDPVRIADPQSKMAMGVGAFNLVKKEYIEPQAGLEWLRMELADDAGLGLMMKQRGANPDILSGRELVSLDWYPNLTSMLNGVLQRCIMGSNYHPLLFAITCTFMFVCLAAPSFLGCTQSSSTPLAWLCLGAYFIPTIAMQAGAKNFGISGYSLWGISLGYAIILYGMLRSLVCCIHHGGVYWRGDIYSLRELRALQRVKMFNFLRG